MTDIGYGRGGTSQVKVHNVINRYKFTKEMFDNLLVCVHVCYIVLHYLCQSCTHFVIRCCLFYIHTHMCLLQVLGQVDNKFIACLINNKTKNVGGYIIVVPPGTLTISYCPLDRLGLIDPHSLNP